MNFQHKLDNIVDKNKSLVCIGLDPVMDKLPELIKQKEHPFFEFNKAIIDSTHDIVCCYKPNSAFYEALGEKGIAQLKMTFDYIKQNYSEIPTILDAKRGDIGSTNEGYVKYAFDYIDADAITLHPYLGKEALEPFLKYTDKGCVVLCKTSNPGAGELQDLSVGNELLYQVVAKKVVAEWNTNGNCLMVVGATYPEELANVRSIAKEMTFLVPGIGTQRGDVEKIVKAGLNSDKKGLIISASRSIIFAGSYESFADKSGTEAEKLRNEINKYRGL